MQALLEFEKAHEEHEAEAHAVEASDPPPPPHFFLPVLALPRRGGADLPCRRTALQSPVACAVPSVLLSPASPLVLS